MSTHNRPTARLLAATVVVGSIAVLATGCSLGGDAWAVTYEVQVDRPIGSELSDLRVEGAEQRGDAPEVRRLGAQDTDTDDGDGSLWRHESVVVAEQHASVRATPPEGATATCRILLDGVREIASETSAQPGQAVHCSADTPAFD